MRCVQHAAGAPVVGAAASLVHHGLRRALNSWREHIGLLEVVRTILGRWRRVELLRGLAALVRAAERAAVARRATLQLRRRVGRRGLAGWRVAAAAAARRAQRARLVDGAPFRRWLVGGG